jgi:hypothetical protein
MKPAQEEAVITGETDEGAVVAVEEILTVAEVEEAGNLHSVFTFKGQH